MRRTRVSLLLMVLSMFVVAAATWSVEGPVLSASNAGAMAPEIEDGRCSPPPQCWSDRDCDRICGKGNGQCIRINSCYRECACSS